MECIESNRGLESTRDDAVKTLLDDVQVRHFNERGFAVLDRVLPAPLLAAMQAECDRNLQLQLDAMDRVGATTLGLSQRNRRYFLPDRFEESNALTAFLFGPLVQSISRSLLGPDAYLFLDLFVVKPPRDGAPFAWHQDGGYLLGRPHKRYLTLWCALDDMTEANGTLSILQYANAPSRDVVAHVKDRISGDLVGYVGNDAGEAIAVPAGSIVVLASDLFHCSGANVSDSPRRAYLASISSEPVRDHGGALWNLAVPLMRDGLAVRCAEAAAQR